MIRHFALIASAGVFAVCVSSCSSAGSSQASNADTTDYASLVNPMIGTDFTGNTYPGAQAPFSLVRIMGCRAGIVLQVIFIRTAQSLGSAIRIYREPVQGICMISPLCL